MNRSVFSSLALLAALRLTLPAGANPLLSSPATPQAPSPGAAADCHNPGVSTDGRFVVFVSAADNLVINDSNGAFDVFVRDRQLAKTMLVSVNSAGTRSGNGPSHSPTMSADGRYVVFESSASDLVANDTNNAADVFVRDLVAGTTTLVSQSTAGAQGNHESTSPTMTPDGRYILFSSRADNLTSGDLNKAVDLFVRDLKLGTTTLVTRNFSNAGSFAGSAAVWDGNARISDDGRWVVFHSAATDLVRGDANAKSDVFVRDLQNATNLLVSVNLAGTAPGNGNSQNASMDATGRYVIFQSAASNLATNDANVSLDLFLRDLVAGTTRLVSVTVGGTSAPSASSGLGVISKQGNAAVFLSTANTLVSGDTNSTSADLFYRDLSFGVTALIDFAVAPTLDAPPPALSADGRYVLYQDARKNLVLFDILGSGRTILATNTLAANGSMTDDGNFIVYIGLPETTGVRNVYLYDQLAATTELISQRDPSLALATGSAGNRVVPGAVSANSQFVVFESYAVDVAAGGTNRTRDVWVSDLAGGPTSAYSLGSVIPGFSRGPSRRPVMSGDAHWVAFEAIPDSTPVAGLATRFNLYAFDRVAQTNLLVAGVGSVVVSSQPAFSQQGGLLTFSSSETGVGGFATTVGQVYYRDLGQASNRLVSLNYQGTAAGPTPSFAPVISPDGRYVAYLSTASGLVPNATSGTNAYLWDSLTGSNLLVSASAGGAGLNQVSRVGFCPNGNILSFQQGTSTYLFDLSSFSAVATLTDAVNASLSADGRLVACERSGSYASADTNGTTDIYLLDRSTGSASLVSLSVDGTTCGNGKSLAPTITPDGRFVVFRSRASNLVANDINGVSDVFLRDVAYGRTILVSGNRNGTGPGNRLSANPLVSADSSTVLFESYASDLLNGDYNDSRDVLVLRLSHGDHDGDGLPDDWELAYFNTLDRDGSGDYDGDGLTDRAEFLAGTDPTDAKSVLRVLTLAPLGAGPVQVLWQAVPGKKDRVQYKDSIDDPLWTDLPGDVLATDFTGSKEDTASGATDQRYYRVLLVP